MGVGAWFAKRVNDGVDEGIREVNALKVTVAGAMSAKIGRDEFDRKMEQISVRLDQMNNILMSKFGVRNSSE